MSMRINIVTPTYEGWILRRLARSFKRHLADCTVSSRPDLAADVNFYVNYALYRHPTACDIGFFTHREKSQAEAAKFDEVASQVDWCVAMCDKTAACLPKEKTTVIHVAPDPQFHRGNLVLGVVAREYDTGRKRIGWLRELRKIPGVDIRFTNGRIPWRLMPWFYRHIDYLLILSDNEGGPMPLLEALAMGVPVISSDVGFVGDYTTIRYRDLDDLKQIIGGLIIPRNAWATAASRLEAVCGLALKARRPRDMAALTRIHRQDGGRLSTLNETMRAVVPRSMKAWLLRTKEQVDVWTQYFGMQRRRLPPFQVDGRRYPYFIHRYNTTWRNERAVEIPIFRKLVQAHAGKRILEVGNVMSHYGLVFHEIVDKCERGKGVTNCDILDFDPVHQTSYDLIVSISTFEHIGFDEGSRYGRGYSDVLPEQNLLRAMDKVRALLAEDGQFVMSVPLGFNRFLDAMIDNGGLRPSNQVFLKRMMQGPQWQQVDYSDVRGCRYGQPFNCANGLMIGFYRR